MWIIQYFIDVCADYSQTILQDTSHYYRIKCKQLYKSHAFNANTSGVHLKMLKPQTAVVYFNKYEIKLQ